MKTNILSLAAGLFLLASCTSNQYVSYTLKNADKQGTVNQQAFAVDYGRFVITYSAEGGCNLRNNSDSMMIVDLGASYFVTDDGNSNCIYDNRVTSTTKTNSSTSTRAYSDRDTYYGKHSSSSSTYTGARSNTATTSTTTVEKEERYVCIPPHASSNLKFFRLQSPSPYLPGTQTFIPQEQFYDENNGFQPCTHVLSYGYGSNQDTRYEMARNEFYITWQTVSKDEQPVSGRNIQHNAVANKKQIIATTIGASAGLIGLIVLSAVLASI